MCVHPSAWVPALFSYFHISARSPSADLPNTAAFLGGLVAQEVIKMITKQYVPIDSYCVVDLVETWTGMV
jgi:amyloid beta precursor protein binding protein 1